MEFEATLANKILNLLKFIISINFKLKCLLKKTNKYREMRLFFLYIDSYFELKSQILTKAISLQNCENIYFKIDFRNKFNLICDYLFSRKI